MILKFSVKGGHSRLTKLLLAGQDKGRELCRITFHLPAVLLLPTTTNIFFSSRYNFFGKLCQGVNGPARQHNISAFVKTFGINGEWVENYAKVVRANKY